jgi:hypothetical protein
LEKESDVRVRSSDLFEFWIDARHLMNELADLLGAAVVVAGPEGAGFAVIAGDDIIDCEQAVGHAKILESRTS